MAEFFVVYVIFAIAWAVMEQFVFAERGFHIGASDCVKVNGSYRLVKKYHGPMAVLFLIPPILVGWQVLPFVITALWLEDMFYYVGNKEDKPDGSENITGALGFWGKVPRLWVAAMVYTGGLIWFLL